MRLLISVIVIPLLLLAVYFSTATHILTLMVVILFFSIMGALECGKLLEKIGTKLNKVIIVYLGAIGPIFTYLLLSPGFDKPLINHDLLPLLATSSLLFILGIEAFVRKQNVWEKSIQRISGYAFIFVYITVLTSFFVLLSDFEHGRIVFLIFLALVFGNDSMAYFTGISIGRFSPNPTPLSPHKSLFGFLGGIISAIFIAIAFYYLNPTIFGNSIIAAISTGAIIAFVSDIGDLIESSFKRSAGVKDSGTIMLGRGGILDSIDSLIVSAPVLYFLLKYFETL